jgi:hemerythrin-like domain-containing protein
VNRGSVTRSDSRRGFVSVMTIAGAGLVLGTGKSSAQQAAPAGGKSKPSDVNATEDLMREHGVLNRVLLIYEEGVRRINAAAPPSADLLSSAAGIIRKFIEDYHEKLEEEQVFPRLEKAGRLVDLTRVLRAQHAAGQKLTAEILKNANAPALKNKGQAQALVRAIQQFIRMYRPHEAREDTVLFPAFHALFTEEEFDKLGDQFEQKEHQLLGSAGFEGTVGQVAQLERAVGIYDLSKFTPA